MNETPAERTAETIATDSAVLAGQAAELLHTGQHPLEQVLNRAVLRIGYVPAVMPGKWFTRWHERYSKTAPLAEIPLREGAGLQALNTPLTLESQGASAGANQPETPENPLAHMVIMRPHHEPGSTNTHRYHSIRLYDEVPVVILPADHVLTVLDEVPLAEIAEEFLLHAPGEFPAWDEASRTWRESTPRYLPEIPTDRDAIELVAAGVGLYIAPLSVARFYRRKDLTYRPVPDAHPYPVTLVWPRPPAGAEPHEEFEAVLQDFIGVVRGRTALSSRGSETDQARRARKDTGKAATPTKNTTKNRATAKNRPGTGKQRRTRNGAKTRVTGGARASGRR